MQPCLAVHDFVDYIVGNAELIGQGLDLTALPAYTADALNLLVGEMVCAAATVSAPNAAGLDLANGHWR